MADNPYLRAAQAAAGKARLRDQIDAAQERRSRRRKPDKPAKPKTTRKK
jgi:hypothetical protein